MTHVSISSDCSRDNQTSIVWFISFGDLLTLLVCFFFVLTPRLTFDRPEDVREELVRKDPASVAGPGTVFANLPLGAIGVGRSKLVIARTEAHDSVWRQELANAWSTFRAVAAVSPRDVTVRTCSNADQRELASAVMEEIEQSRQQLRSWSLELMASCDAEQATSGSEVIAVLEFSEL